MKVGDRISHYLLEEKVGEGGFGDVFRARDTTTGMNVAIKCSRPDAAESKVSDREQRFLREVSVISKVRHPGIVQLFDYGIHDDGTFFLVMEYVSGLNLEVLIARDAPFSYAYASDIILQVLDALAEAHHQGIVHRDLKPANIMIVRQGIRTDVVKLCDFGIAKAFNGSEPDLTRQNFSTAVGFGTPQYMPPEQFYGKKVGPHSDLYAVGLVFYELLTGQQACGGASLSEVIEKQIKKFPEVPAPFNEGPLMAVFKRALAKKISERYTNAAEMYYDIDAISRYHSPFLDKYMSAAGAMCASFHFDEGTRTNAQAGKYSAQDDKEDEIPSFDMAAFGDVDISNSNTMLFAGEPTSVTGNSMEESTSVNSMGAEPTCVNKQAVSTGIVIGGFEDYDEFGPTDDMSRVDPAVALQTALNISGGGAAGPNAAPPLPNQNAQRPPFPPGPPAPPVRNSQKAPPVPKPPAPKGFPSYPRPGQMPMKGGVPQPPARPPRKEELPTNLLDAVPQGEVPPTNLLDAVSDELRIPTNSNQRPIDYQSPGGYAANGEPDISGLQTSINYSAMPDDDEDDLPPIFHQQPTKFMHENDGSAISEPRTEDLPPVFHEQRTHFIGKRNNPENETGLMGAFLNSSFYRACRHGRHRISLFIDILYEKHFEVLVIVVCFFFIVLVLLISLLVL